MRMSEEESSSDQEDIFYDPIDHELKDLLEDLKGRLIEEKNQIISKIESKGMVKTLEKVKHSFDNLLNYMDECIKKIENGEECEKELHEAMEQIHEHFPIIFGGKGGLTSEEAHKIGRDLQKSSKIIKRLIQAVLDFIQQRLINKNQWIENHRPKTAIQFFHKHTLYAKEKLREYVDSKTSKKP